MFRILNKLNNFLSISIKRKFGILSILLLLGMVLEFVGIGLLVPILEIISNQDFRSNTIFTDYIPAFIKSKTDQEILFLFLFFIVFIYFFKTVFMGILSFKQNKFIYGINSTLTNKLYQLYLSQEYRFHIKKSSALLSKNLITELRYFSFYLNAILVILTETLFISTVILCVIWINPISTLTVGMFFTILSVIYFSISKKFVKRWSKDRKKLEDLFTITLHEGIRGIRDVKMYGIIDPYVKKFQKEKSEINYITSKFTTLNAFPRYFFELLTVLTLVFYLAVVTLYGLNMQSLISTIGIFIAATFRILPSVNKILVSIQGSKFYNSSVNYIIGEFEEASKGIEDQENHSRTEFYNSIQIKSLRFSYNLGKKNILDNLNLEISKGSIIGIKGSSGSGKTTFIDLFVALQKPTQGQILVDGVSIFKNINGWRNNIGYVSQFVFLSDTTIAENIAFGKSKEAIDYRRLDKVIKMAQLSTFIKELPNGIESKVGESGINVSGGQKQRIGIARALYNNPEILVLDEATSSLDDNTEKNVMKSIYKLKGEKTILIVAHRLSTLDKCDIIYNLDSGKFEEEKKFF